MILSEDDIKVINRLIHKINDIDTMLDLFNKEHDKEYNLIVHSALPLSMIGRNPNNLPRMIDIDIDQDDKKNFIAYLNILRLRAKNKLIKYGVSLEDKK